MIGIIGAMEEEVVQLKAKLSESKVAIKASMEFNQGKLLGKDVVIVRSGIGKVNAAICAQILVDDYKVDVIINTGIAGSLSNEINIGDIVLSTDALQHDVDAVAFGYLKGVIPRMETSIFKAEESLVTLAKFTCESVNPDIRCFAGRVVSGDQFIADQLIKEQLVACFDPMCTEMEGAAIAQVAYLNKLPFLIIRAISDKADNSAKMDYPTFEAKAIEHTVKLMNALIVEM
jgi:adenosylhomocysteine nucleosidase